MAPLRAVKLNAPRPGPMAGLVLEGYTEISPGNWVPLYDSPPPEDRQSINTREGWNAFAERMRKEHENRVHAGKGSGAGVGCADAR